MHINLSIQLPDGRQLGYGEYGLQGGSPVLFFHGAPGSGRIHTDMGEIAEQCGVRLIAVDRPGYGVSDSHRGRTFLSWVKDISVLMDALKISQFSIIGFSAGTPYSLACAYGLPERVKKIALVSTLAPVSVPGVMEGMSPMARGLYELAQKDPSGLSAAFAAVAPTARALLEAMSASAGEWDKKILLNRASAFELEYTQTLLNGIEGLASDFILNAGDWGFPIEKIEAEVYLWSGGIDQNTPPSMTHYMAALLCNSHVYILENEGHFVLYAHWAEILNHMK